MNTILYNPAQKSKKELLAEFAVRQQVYEEIMQDLESSKMRHPEQNYLLVGQRGMGKTTLLLRLKYGIEDSKILKDRLISVAFTEEQYQIIELVNLWEYIAEYLEDHCGFENLYQEILQQIQHESAEEKAFEALEKALKKEKKHLALLIDNIGDLFNKLDQKEMYRLREILQTKNTIRIIGGSTNYMEALLDYHQPFYEFFKIIRLDGLSKDETIQLLLNLGELSGEKKKIGQIIKKTPGRIETMRILTGGVPRTISILFGIFLDYEHEHAIKDLYKILDRVTPLYKHRMDDLPVQQQKIVDAVARYWEPITVKELTTRTRIPSKTLSAQLNQLEKDQIVIKNDTDTKNKTYLIRERFWNIWYLMRYGRRDDKEKIVWLVNFLESWLSIDDIKKRIESFVQKVKKADIDNEQKDFLSKVYIALKNMPPSSKLKLKSIEKEIKKEITLSDEEWHALAKEEFTRGNYFEAFTHLSNINEWNNALMDFLVLFVPDKVYESINERSQEILEQSNFHKFRWLYPVLELFRHNTRVMHHPEKVDYEEEAIFLKHSLEIYLEFHRQWGTIFIFQQAVYLVIVTKFANLLITRGLYNVLCKMVEEIFIIENGQKIFLKEYWKPFYLAVKYLYQPEELEKQPSELAEAIGIASILNYKKK